MEKVSTWTIAVLILWLGNVLADDEFLVKRMENRLGDLVKLKLRKMVFEGEDGFLAVTANAELDTKAATLVEAENQDRKQLYGAIGARVQPPLSAEEVGELRATIWEPEAPPAAPLVSQSTEFAMHGSNTIGAYLGPALVAGWLKSRGAKELVRVQGDSLVECTLHAELPQGASQVFVAGHGSGTAYPALVRGEAQVGMSSRPIKEKEAELLKELGEMQSPDCEFVIALDALPILVHPQNPVESLSVQQVRDIFSGKIDNWSRVGGTPGPINRYSRDEKSGTRDTFDSLVMGGDSLAPGTLEFEDNAALSDSVADDPSGIGYTGIAYVRRCKVLAISAGAGLKPLYPTRQNVATEQYAISRRLYLYSPIERPERVADFLSWVVSDPGQAVVEQTGFIPLSIVTSSEPGQRVVTGVREFDDITAKTERIPVVFRFRPGSLELDSKSKTDLSRLVEFIKSDEERQKQDLVLVGFSDESASAEPPAKSVERSKQRARAVASLLAEEGLESKVVTGVGSALPIADNATEQGRQKNRRVEVYLADSLL